MSEVEVTCVNKPDRMSAHEHITHIGNTAANWRMTREEAIRRIDSKQEAFYTIDRATNRKMYIGVVRGDGLKAPYLRTHADIGERADTLRVVESGAATRANAFSDRR
jgi:hypothetical protein